MIITCTCTNKYQDEKHGSGKRVANVCPTSDGSKKYRCTVCNTVSDGKPKQQSQKKG